MTPEEFSKAHGRTRIRRRLRLAARLVLVKGLTMSEAARHCKVSRQAVHVAVRRIERALLERTHTLPGRPRAVPPDIPEHWETVTVIVTPDAADAVRGVERDLWEQLVPSQSG